MIPFTVTIPKEERDPKLLDKLQGELPGILAWAVRGCLLWQRDGLMMPASVKEATDSYRHETDDVHAFLEERCERGISFKTQSMILYTAYRDGPTSGASIPLTMWPSAGAC